MSPLLDFSILTILCGRGEFTVKGWSDVMEDAKFDILGSSYFWLKVGVPIIRLCHLTILRGRAEFAVNGWLDVVENAKFQIFGSNDL